MGVGIRMRLSKSITRNEWEKVYDESLQLIKTFPLAEMRCVECKGVETLCLVQTEDRVENRGRNCGRRYWRADCDYINMHTAEEYMLFRDMFQENELSDDKGDRECLILLPTFYLDLQDN